MKVLPARAGARLAPPVTLAMAIGRRGARLRNVQAGRPALSFRRPAAGRLVWLGIMDLCQ